MNDVQNLVDQGDFGDLFETVLIKFLLRWFSETTVEK